MEHTKGELEAIYNTIYRKQTYIGGCVGYFEKTVLSDDVNEANAKELVRRWNAFEDGGIVEELRKTVDEEYALRLKVEKQRDKMKKALEDCAFLADTAIASTPTGNLRNKLTEINILREAALAKS